MSNHQNISNIITTDNIYYEDNESEDYIEPLKTKKDICTMYPTIIDSYERITYSCEETTVYKLYIVYTIGKTIMLDFYYKKDWLSFLDDYELRSSKTFTETINRLKSPGGLYGFLTNAKCIYITRNLKPHLMGWLEKARKQIVARETHPSRVNELLESGVDLDDIDKVIDSKLAVKLSW